MVMSRLGPGVLLAQLRERALHRPQHHERGRIARVHPAFLRLARDRREAPVRKLRIREQQLIRGEPGVGVVDGQGAAP